MPVLLPHPDTPCPAVQHCAVRIDRTDGGLLTLEYLIEGEIADFRVPAPRASHRADGLWRATCGEVFLAAVCDPGYFEFNFAPSGEWACYRFDGYRAGARAPEIAVPPRLRCRVTPFRLWLEAGLDLSSLAPGLERADLRLALATVIETADGALAYFALRHPPGVPDFHHTEGFAERLAAPSPPKTPSGKAS